MIIRSIEGRIMRMNRNTGDKMVLAGASLTLALIIFGLVARALDDIWVALLLTGLAVATAASLMVPKTSSLRRFGRG